MFINGKSDMLRTDHPYIHPLVINNAEEMLELLRSIWNRIDGINRGQLSIAHQEAIERLVFKMRTVKVCGKDGPD